MKKFVHQLCVGKDFKITISLIFAIFALVVLGCSGGSKTNSKPIPSEYFGSWTGNDGSTISIRGDGSGDYRSGNFKVEGGKAEISEDGKSISITFFGIGKTLKIDQAPSGNQMKLEGVTYTKGGSTTTTSTSDKPSDSSKTTSSGDVPSDSELNSLVHKSLEDFADAVDSEDFSDYRETTSSAFKSQFSADKLKTTFDTFIKQKDKLVPLIRSTDTLTPTFSPAPSVSAGELKVNGSFSAKQTVNFELTFVKEGGEWKGQGIRVKI